MAIVVLALAAAALVRAQGTPVVVTRPDVPLPRVLSDPGAYYTAVPTSVPYTAPIVHPQTYGSGAHQQVVVPVETQVIPQMYGQIERYHVIVPADDERMIGVI